MEVLKHKKIKVTALALDMGDGIDAALLRRITKHYGVDLIIEDARQSFIRHSILKAIQAQAMYLGDYPVSSSLSRPVMVNHAIKIAHKIGCEAIIHTANLISGTVTFSLSRGKIFMTKIVANNPLYLTDRDAWETKVALEHSQRSLVIEQPFIPLRTSA